MIPSYYDSEDKTIQAIDVINAYDLNFNRGNVIKYVLRAGRKSYKTGGGDDMALSAIADLEKAKTYIEFEIARINRMRAKP